MPNLVEDNNKYVFKRIRGKAIDILKINFKLKLLKILLMNESFKVYFYRRGKQTSTFPFICPLSRKKPDKKKYF